MLSTLVSAVAPSAGMVVVAGGSSVASTNVLLSPIFHVVRPNAGQGSAGRNCSVRAFSQVNAPGCAGVMVT